MFANVATVSTRYAIRQRHEIAARMTPRAKKGKP